MTTDNQCSDDYENVGNESLDTSSNEGYNCSRSSASKWSKIDIPVYQQQQYKKLNSKAPMSIKLNSHQLCELFFDD